MGTAPVVIEDPGPRVGQDPIPAVFLIENHDQAYLLWRAAAVKQKVLAHVDAHHDMWWVERQAPRTIANFICRALQEELVREVYWVVPDSTWDSARNRRHLIGHLRKIVRQYPGNRPPTPIGVNQVSTQVLGKPLHFCSLRSLPSIAESILLDIDVDFLLLPRVTYGENDPHPTLPWCWPEELLGQLGARGLRSALVTIAYSVEGGYTPLRWKYLGDELALRLKQPDPGARSVQGMVRMREAAEAAEQGQLATAEEKYQQASALLPNSAAPAWHLAGLYLAMHRSDEAKRMYQEALALDPSYRTPYNSAGLWHLWSKRLRAAQQEYKKTLALDPRDAYAHLGLGWLAMRRKKWREAETLLREALELDDQLLDAHRALGDVLVKQNRREDAIAAYERSLKLALAGRKPLDAPIATSGERARLSDPGHSRTYLRLARLREQKGATPQAINLYRIAAAGGQEGVLLRSRLARLRLKQRDWRGAAQETWLAVKLFPSALGKAGERPFRWVQRKIRSAYEVLLAY